MSDKLFGELFAAIIELTLDRLIAYFKLESARDIVMSVGGLALMIIGVYANLAGWW